MGAQGWWGRGPQVRNQCNQFPSQRLFRLWCHCDGPGLLSPRASFNGRRHLPGWSERSNRSKLRVCTQHQIIFLPVPQSYGRFQQQQAVINKVMEPRDRIIIKYFSFFCCYPIWPIFKKKYKKINKNTLDLFLSKDLMHDWQVVLIVSLWQKQFVFRLLCGTLIRVFRPCAF